MEGYHTSVRENQLNCNNKINDTSTNKLNLEDQCSSQNNDLLEPKHYPDPVLFRDSLDELKKYDEELKNSLKTNKTTLNVLAPYLKTIYKDQKKVLAESAKNLSFSAKTKEAKLLMCDQKTKDHANTSTAPTDITEQYELIVSIHETADALRNLVKANTVVSYLVNPTKNELYQSPRYLVSSMDSLTWKIETGTTMAAYAAATKQYVLSDNVLADARFPLGLGFVATLVKYGLCVPVKTTDDKVIAIYELSRDAFATKFELRDIEVILTVVGWMGFAIQYNNLCTGLMRRLEVSDYLLQLTDHYHGGHATLNETLSDIVTFAKQTVAAERSNFFLVEKGTDDTLIIEEYSQDNENMLFKRKRKKNIARDDGSYLSLVVFGKEIINKYETQVEISRNLDHTKVRSVVSVPIVCKCEEVIGIIQLINKKTATQFDKDDEDILQMFAVFFAINLNNHILQEAEKKSLLQNNVSREMLLYHMTPCGHDQEIVKKPLENLPNDFFTINWYLPNDCRVIIPQLTLHMFHDVLGDYFMSSNDVQKFVLTVRNSYRPNSYHNFTHAFNASHKMATILRSYSGMFSGVERQSLMIAILCHDVDHQSYSNSFIKLTEHHLSKLYDSSPMENHHFAVTKIIIEKNGLFKYLKPDTYNKVLKEIYECIMATDLTYYFQSRTKLLKLADEQILTLKEQNHRRLIKDLMMISCDLSDQVIPFPECRKLTEDLYEELYYQGDLIKKQGLIPMPLMDRLQKDMIPENQIQFLMVVLLPCLETLSQIFETASPLISNCKEVIRQWRMLVEVKDQDTWKPEESLPKPTTI